jgi:hypothetical protein
VALVAQPDTHVTVSTRTSSLVACDIFTVRLFLLNDRAAGPASVLMTTVDDNQGTIDRSCLFPCAVKQLSPVKTPEITFCCYPFAHAFLTCVSGVINTADAVEVMPSPSWLVMVIHPSLGGDLSTTPPKSPSHPPERDTIVTITSHLMANQTG